MKFAFWRRWAAAQGPVHEFPKDQPLVAQTPREKAKEAQKPMPQKQAQVQIAEKERKKPSAHINSVDVALDDYDDIFSDFDPSPYKTRLLSKDFLDEISRRNRETKAGDIEVRLTLQKRKGVVENIIRERLGEYYRMRAQKADEEIRAREIKGWKYMGIGVALNITGMLIIHFLESINVGFKVGGGLIEMAGWISTWVGAERAILETPKEMREQKEFHERMSRANFVFMSEEDVVKRIEKTAVEAGKPPEKKEEKKEKKSAEPAAPGVAAAEAAAPAAGPSSAGTGGDPSG
jgi:hypothetical protein